MVWCTLLRVPFVAAVAYATGLLWPLAPAVLIALVFGLGLGGVAVLFGGRLREAASTRAVAAGQQIGPTLVIDRDRPAHGQAHSS